MKIRLDRLEDEPFAWEEGIELSPEELDHDGVDEVGAVWCRGTISTAPPGYLLRAELEYVQALRCTRCLVATPATVRCRFEVSLLVAELEATEGEQELTEDDLGSLYLSEPIVDTRPLVVEQVALNVPMKSLCREGCPGICSRCGADLNAGPCGCREDQDPRWSALEGLRSRLSNG